MAASRGCDAPRHDAQAPLPLPPAAGFPLLEAEPLRLAPRHDHRPVLHGVHQPGGVRPALPAGGAAVAAGAAVVVLGRVPPHPLHLEAEALAPPPQDLVLQTLLRAGLRDPKPPPHRLHRREVLGAPEQREPAALRPLPEDVGGRPDAGRPVHGRAAADRGSRHDHHLRVQGAEDAAALVQLRHGRALQRGVVLRDEVVALLQDDDLVAGAGEDGRRDPAAAAGPNYHHVAVHPVQVLAGVFRHREALLPEGAEEGRVRLVLGLYDALRQGPPLG
uniref:Potassium/sodium hyperpolarization-activated cyclic nucleotide-gated channel 1 n=1 Tax=Anthurium amnicola TaxID=1678845 RepID=A0A1D1XV27_9ARAE